MSLKRKILFTSYLILKKRGYIKLKNSFSNKANILAFHRVNDYDNSNLSTSINMFDKVMWSIQQYYNSVPLQFIIDRLHKGKKITPKTIAITFDDGYRDNLLYAAPILKKYNIPATFFVTSGYINTQRIFPWDEASDISHPIMTWEEVRELQWMGFEIGAHTINHVNLDKISESKTIQEISQCKKQIEDQVKAPVTTIAIPFGRKKCVSPNAEKIIKEAGYQASCMLRGGKVTEKSNPYYLPRVPIYPSYIEMMMELDNYMVYYDNKMKFNFFL